MPPTRSTPSPVPRPDSPDVPLLDPRDPDPGRRDRLLAWLRVQCVFGFRPQDAAAALRAGAAPEAVWRLAGAERRAQAASLRVGDALWRRLEASGAVALPLTSPAYPERLRRLVDAPPLLFATGDAGAAGRRCVAVVGSRAATAYGRRIAQELGESLGAAGVVVVSGLAHGIDACAHRGALDAGGTTVAVQGRGPDGIYPRVHAALAERITGSGALLSEFAPGTPPRAAHFPLRNRLISALAELVVVVEARARSGSLLTARHALDQGVDVFVVPGPVDVPTSEGTNALLRDGAGVALSPDDVLGALGIDAAAARARAESLPETLRPVLDALRDAPATRDELAARLGCPPHALAHALTELELAGRVEVAGDGRLRARG